MNTINSLNSNQLHDSKTNLLQLKQTSICANNKNSLESSPAVDTFENKKKKHTGLWVALGTAITAGLAIGFDYWKFGGKHCKNLSKKVTNLFKSKSTKINELKNIIARNKRKLEMQFNGTGAEAELSQRLEGISKLPIEEQKAEIDKLLDVCEKWHLKLKRRKDSDILKGLPNDVQQALKGNKLIEACEKYQNYYESLPSVVKPKNSGKTFEETVKNVFGTEEKLAEHTYDLKKESGVAIAQRNYAGFEEIMTTPEGLVRKMSNEQRDIFESLTGFDSSKKFETIDIGNGKFIKHGRTKSNKYFVELRLSDGEGMAAIPMTIWIPSPNSKITPVQKDLIKIAQKHEKLDADIFRKITERTPCEPADTMNTTEWRNFDYNLLLSAIQSMAK